MCCAHKTHNNFLYQGQPYTVLFFFVNFFINSTFALDVVNFTGRHEWHSVSIDTTYVIFPVTPYSKNGDNQCCIISLAAN